VLQPAGLEKSKGIISAGVLRDVSDPQEASSSEVKQYFEWMQQYYPEGNALDPINVYGYTVAQAMVHVLTVCGENLTREYILRQASNLKQLELPLLRRGITLNTTPTDYYPIEQLQLIQFNGERWVNLSEIIDVSDIRKP
jgi:hypothetical protein